MCMACMFTASSLVAEEPVRAGGDFTPGNNSHHCNLDPQLTTHQTTTHRVLASLQLCALALAQGLDNQ